jgi:hypothetical protein
MSTTVTLIIHPNRTSTAGPAGYRFAIHITAAGELANPGDLSQVANAGWLESLEWCELEGQHHAKTAIHALRLAGIDAREEHRRTDLDPFPPTD